jgi:8-hydroxy-5-deazaflavin:NADPH oxidoreductase
VTLEIGKILLMPTDASAGLRRDMQKGGITIIGGTGNQGLGLALRWAGAGYRVVIGSRDRDRALSAADEVKARLGSQSEVEGMENQAAVVMSPVVVLTVPFEAQIRTLKSLRSAFREGQTLVDVTVPLETAVGGVPTRVLGLWSGSAAEQAAQYVPPGVTVTAAFHNVSAYLLKDVEKPVDCDVFVCGETEAARLEIRPWVEAVPGCRYVDGGRLANARIVESITGLLVGVNQRYHISSAGIRVTGLTT